MKRLILSVTLALAVFSGFSQHELGLYFMPGTIQSQRYNPAFLQDEKINIGLISLGTGVGNTGFSFGDLILPVSGTSQTELDVSNAIGIMDDMNHLRFRTALDAMNVSVKLRDLQIGFGYQAIADAYVNYPKTLAELAWEGNTQFVGREVDIAPGFQAQAYHEFAFSAGWSVNSFLQAGMRMKYLVGLANISSGNQSATVLTDPSHYATTITTDYVIRSSMIDMGTPDDVSFEFEPSPFTQNTGYAVDAGLVVQLTKRISVAVSGVNLLNSINWQDSVTQFTSNGSYTFTGVDAGEALTGGEVDFESTLDSISERLEFVESNENYTSNVPTQVYASVHFNPINSFRLGALFFQEFYRGEQFPGMMISASKDVGKIFTAGLTYSMRKRSFENLGANIMLRGGPVVLFMVTDNFTALLSPRSAREFNLRWGLNVALK